MQRYKISVHGISLVIMDATMANKVAGIKIRPLIPAIRHGPKAKQH